MCSGAADSTASDVSLPEIVASSESAASSVVAVDALAHAARTTAAKGASAPILSVMVSSTYLVEHASYQRPSRPTKPAERVEGRA
jgi:hypothetical protein